MSQNELKQKAAVAAIDYIEDDSVLGIGSGTTVAYFIEALGRIKHRIDGCVASSKETEERLKAQGVRVLDMNVVSQINLYIDGADEINFRGEMKKGGGGALTREKIIASYAKQYLCIIDESKLKSFWGDFPVTVEVIPMARSAVGRELVKLGGSPSYREGFLTDNGNILLDVYQLDLTEAKLMENKINQIVGVVENGLFANCCANHILLGTLEGVQHIKI
jgi:ribose 5-phosphate isomerase A